HRLRRKSLNRAVVSGGDDDVADAEGDQWGELGDGCSGGGANLGEGQAGVGGGVGGGLEGRGGVGRGGGGEGRVPGGGGRGSGLGGGCEEFGVRRAVGFEGRVPGPAVGVVGRDADHFRTGAADEDRRDGVRSGGADRVFDRVVLAAKRRSRLGPEEADDLQGL